MCKRFLNPEFMLLSYNIIDNPLMDNSIGSIIKARLKELKHTQSWLAEQCGVSDNAVAKWIRTSKVSRDSIKKIAKVLNMPADKLLGGKFDTINNELERQLIMFFRGVKPDHQDDLLTMANNLYNIDNPNDLTANPTNGKKKKEVIN
jgi:transcriptional regulator with XRE-family HTH domain